MKKLVVMTMAALVLTGATAANARHWHHHHGYWGHSFGMMRSNAEGRGNNGNSFWGSNSLMNSRNFGSGR